MTEISDALIHDIQEAMGTLMRQQRPGMSHEVMQLDMPIGQMKTLFILWTAGKPQTMGQLAQALDVSLGNVTGLVDGLVQRGLARREEDPKDRRQKLASLTSNAEARLLRMEQGRSLMIQRLLRRMQVDDLRALRQGVIALTAAAGAERQSSSSTRTRKVADVS
ncbi:MAG TPA: MarR family transcriptional regulator [Candidatus Dormibacteraeota bacterium]|nr:MarR family transcriptional regulator [Candidatus Dormibacteraeota bacterium]